MLNRSARLFLIAALTLASAWAAALAVADEGEDAKPASVMAPQMMLGDYLGRAIERGVPLFNAGLPEACAAVYATALEGVAYGDDWGVDTTQRVALEYQLQISAAIADPSERAWAYRRLIDALLSGEMLEMPASVDARTLFDFSAPDQVQRWGVVVDGVMGGLSTGQVSQQGETLVFTGATSLRNNGGFSSIRAPIPAGSVAGFDALRIRVKGDGRTWILGARGAGMRGDSFWHRFDTREGEWQTVTVPVTEMVRQFFGTPIEGRLQPAGVRGLEFYIYDKQAGPFRLEVDRIEAVRTSP
jgi:monofunctional biosynthetic peptidoglycan transglycosylase